MLLPLGALAIFSLASPRTPEFSESPQKNAATVSNPITDKKATVKPFSSRQVEPGLSGNGQASGKTIVANAHKVLEEARASLKKNEAGNAEMRGRMAEMTPEQEQAAVERLLNFRKPHYQALFKSWSIDPEEGDEALAIIHARDLKVRGLMNQYAREGTSFAKEYAAQRRTAEDAATEQFIAIFGVNRAEELSRFEKDPRSFLK